MNFEQRQRFSRRKAIALATAIALLLHIVALWGVFEIWQPEAPEPPKRHEVVLVSPAPEKEEPKPQAETQPTPAPMPSKPKEKTPEASRPEPVAQRKAQPAPGETFGPPERAGPAGEVATTEKKTPEPPRPSEINLGLDWSSFERAFGTEQAEQRRAYAQESLKKRRQGFGFGEMTGRVRQAMANNKSFVVPGNQEPLGPRKQVFRSYIDIIHDRIHVVFADSFLGSLPSLAPDHPLNDFSLSALTEIEILENGHLSEVRLVRTSGNTVFDAAAVDSIYRSAPFNPPPRAILSWNNRVYLRWGFHRNRRKCGVFNVEPYILRAPGEEKQWIDTDDAQMMVEDG